LFIVEWNAEFGKGKAERRERERERELTIMIVWKPVVRRL